MPTKPPTHRPGLLPSLSERPRTAARGYGGRWQRLRRMYLRAHPLCVQCGAAAAHVDHVIPRAEGGTDDEANLQALCHSCHSRKTVRHDGGFGRAKG